MKINVLSPQGYCGGVKHAIEIVNKVINDPNTKKPIYLLGQIIHNEHVINEIKSKGVIVLEGKSKLELLDSINSGTIIFSAHGVAPIIYEKAKEKGLNIVDATCSNVLIVHKKIKEFLDLNYDIIYIGSPKHPESEGVLGISNKIHFISNIDDINNLNINNKNIYITNQTTLSMFDINEYFDLLKSKYPTSIIEDKICRATTVRQEAVAYQEKVDLCIVVGDKMSSNSKKLAKVSNEIAKIKTIFCEDLKSLDKNELMGINSVSITSGASTPEYITKEIIEYLKTL